MLVEAAWAAVRHPGCPRSLYHRHMIRNGGHRSPVAKKKATVTAAHTMTVTVWHVLATGKPHHELGQD